MKGVILSGGKGSRLAPLTDSYPKQLIPILGKPILIHSIEYLQNSGIQEIAIIVSPDKGHLIEEEVRKYDLDLNIQFIYQDEPRGLAHAIGLTKDFTKGDDFIVLLGDNLFDKRLTDLINRFYAYQADSLILLKDVTHPYNFGVVKFDDSGRAVKLVEKPKFFVSNYAIVGVYIFNTLIYDSISAIKASPRGEFEITDAIAHQVEMQKKVQTSILDSYWFDTGTREGLLDANCRMLLAKNQVGSVNTTTKSSFMFGKIETGSGSNISGSNLMGPIHIGKNVKIINSTIGPYTSISDNCVIENAEIQSSIVMQDTKIIDSQIVSTVVFKESLLEKEPMSLQQLLIRQVASSHPEPVRTQILT